MPRIIHPERHPLAGATVTIKSGQHKDSEYHIEDWWDRLSGGSWMDATGNMAALQYSIRARGLPMDNEVVYGHIGSFGYLIHVSEFDGEAETANA